MIVAARLYLLGTARFEIAMAFAATVAVVAAQLVIGLQVSSLTVDPSCLLIVAETCDFETVARRQAALADSTALQIVGLGIAVAIAALLGTSAIATEIESGTVQTAWWLDRQRRRWFVARVLAFGGLTVVLLIVLAVASHWFQSIRQPFFDPGAAFDSYRFRGPALLAAGLGAFGASVLLGALIGRTLPVVILAVGLSLALVGLAHVAVFPNLAERELLVDDPRLPAWPHEILESRYQAPDGTILTLDAARAVSPFAPARQEFWNWLSETFQSVPFGYPGSAYWIVAIRELGIWAALSALMVSAAWFLVSRRRPT